MEQTDIQILPEKTIIFWRGACGLCPRCGKGKLFKSYLKQNAVCPVCEESFIKFRADDGPAWLTILLTGHVIVPMAVYFSMHDVMPEWAALTLLLICTIGMALLVLPRAKGLFISVLWWLAKRKPAPERIY